MLNSAALAIKGTRIQELGDINRLQTIYASYKRLDGQGRLCMPGWTNTHMHLYSTFARGLALKKTPRNFIEILQKLWWRLDKALDAQSICYSALLPAIVAVKNGVTSLIDHHASPNAINGSLDRIEEALRKIGLRAVLCYEVSDRDGEEKMRQGLAENERFIKKCRQTQPTLFTATIGLHAAFTLSDTTLEQSARLGELVHKGFHLHLAEDKADDAYKNYGISTTERLAKFGILGRQTLAAHAVHISKSDRQLLADSQTMVVHNPQSNLNNAVGRANVFNMLELGITVGLGTDGMSAGLAGDIRAASLIHKQNPKNPAAGWLEIPQIVLKNNPQIYRRLSGQSIGRIQKGALADLILVDYFPPTPLTGANIWAHLLYGVLDAPVDTTIINGRIIMKNKQLVNIDEQEIAARSRELAEQVWKKI